MEYVCGYNNCVSEKKENIGSQMGQVDMPILKHVNMWQSKVSSTLIVTYQLNKSSKFYLVGQAKTFFLPSVILSSILRSIWLPRYKTIVVIIQIYFSIGKVNEHKI